MGCQSEAKITKAPPEAHTEKTRQATTTSAENISRVVTTTLEVALSSSTSSSVSEAQKQSLDENLQKAMIEQLPIFEACWGGTGKEDIIHLHGSFRLTAKGAVVRFRTLEWGGGPTRQQECLTSKIKGLELPSVVAGQTPPAKGYWVGTLTFNRGYGLSTSEPRHFEKSKAP